MLLLRQRQFTADQVVKGLVARPNRLGNLPDRGSQILTVPGRLLRIPLQKALINSLDMIVQIVIELGVALVGAAQRLIIPLHDLCLLLLQPRDFRLHLTLAVDSIKQDCEQ